MLGRYPALCKAGGGGLHPLPPAASVTSGTPCPSATSPGAGNHAEWGTWEAQSMSKGGKKKAQIGKGAFSGVKAGRSLLPGEVAGRSPGWKSGWDSTAPRLTSTVGFGAEQRRCSIALPGVRQAGVPAGAKRKQYQQQTSKPETILQTWQVFWGKEDAENPPG